MIKLVRLEALSDLKLVADSPSRFRAIHLCFSNCLTLSKDETNEVECEKWKKWHKDGARGISMTGKVVKGVLPYQFYE